MNFHSLKLEQPRTCQKGNKRLKMPYVKLKLLSKKKKHQEYVLNSLLVNDNYELFDSFYKRKILNNANVEYFISFKYELRRIKNAILQLPSTSKWGKTATKHHHTTTYKFR